MLIINAGTAKLTCLVQTTLTPRGHRSFPLKFLDSKLD